MANLTTVGLTAGAGSSGTGTVSTLDNVFQTGTPIAVKAASTAPVATDPALVVALSPNSSGIVNTGTAGSPATQVLTVQGILNGTSASVTPTDQYGKYNTVLASQTAQALTGGSGGATGDYLAYVTVFPGAAGCGVVTILDSTTTVGTFAGGGTTALPSLVPFQIPVGAFSASGPWKITTGSNVTAVAVGKFT